MVGIKASLPSNSDSSLMNRAAQGNAGIILSHLVHTHLGIVRFVLLFA